MLKLRILVQILKTAVVEWDRDNVPRLGAALAYYTLFALAPLLIVAIALAGAVFGEDAARGEVVNQVAGLIGRPGAEAVQALLTEARSSGRAIPATVIGLITFFLAATGAFAQLQGALNTVWDVTESGGNAVIGFLKKRLLSFGMVLGIGFLLLVSLALSAALAAVGRWLDGTLPGGHQLWVAINFLVSYGIVTLLFALIYKVLPDVDLAWRDVWVGAILTAGFFTLGKFLIGLYLGRSSVTSSYGAAGSVVIVMLWVYYSAQVMLFGAEVTQAWVRRYGSKAPQGPEPLVRPEPEDEKALPDPSEAAKPAI